MIVLSVMVNNMLLTMLVFFRTDQGKPVSKEAKVVKETVDFQLYLYKKMVEYSLCQIIYKKCRIVRNTTGLGSDGEGWVVVGWS